LASAIKKPFKKCEQIASCKVFAKPEQCSHSD
jgi:hypothetical protein